MRRLLIFLLVIGLSCLFILEFGLYLSTVFGLVPKDVIPSYDISDLTKPNSSHIRDINEFWGAWHTPNTVYLEKKPGISCQYSFNSVGARDSERSMISRAPRALIVGDSFIEGFLIETEKRLSNLLEKLSGIEVMNFGVGGTGSTQYYQIYKHLASHFDHNFLLVGIFPQGNFGRDNYEIGKVFHNMQFRPYWVGNYPNYEIQYYNRAFFGYTPVNPSSNEMVRRFLSRVSITYRTAYHIKRAWQTNTAFNGVAYCGFYDFTHADWGRLRHSLEQIINLSTQKRVSVLVFTVPVWSDVLRYRYSGQPPLSQNLYGLAKDLGFTFVDLLPGFALKCQNDGLAPQTYWMLPADGHWSDRGNELALELLKPALRSIGFPINY